MTNTKQTDLTFYAILSAAKGLSMKPREFMKWTRVETLDPAEAVYHAENGDAIISTAHGITVMIGERLIEDCPTVDAAKTAASIVRRLAL